VTGDQEQETGSGFSVLALSSPDTNFVFVPLQSGPGGEPLLETPVGDCPMADCEAWIPFLNPFRFASDQWLRDWNALHPTATCIGGLASGKGEDSTGVVLNGKILSGGVVTGFVGSTLRLHPIVSQGCRPIGEPLTVTRAENNIVYALGAQPAYQALETAFQTLSEEEKSTARGNLFAGLATSEYVEDFLPGDFLIRNIIGADPNSGAVVIGGVPRIGQTLQYQYRDRDAASSDLSNGLLQAARGIPNPVGSLVFRCMGRGEKFFGQAGHDISLLREVFGPHPSSGFLCSGEIGPVNSVNCLTAYTAAIALFYDKTP